jgi:hypothetical protein
MIWRSIFLLCAVGGWFAVVLSFGKNPGDGRYILLAGVSLICSLGVNLIYGKVRSDRSRRKRNH